MSDELPPSWVAAPIVDLAELNPRAFCPLARAATLPVHFVPMSAVTEEFGGIEVARRRPLGEVQKGYTSFLADDVLFAKITPCMENGKVAIVPELPDHVAFGSTEFHVLRSNGSVLPQWLAYYVAQSEFRRLARQHMSGSAGQMRVPTAWLSTHELPIAPIGEQTRVIEKLEELLSDLDTGVAELKAAQKKLARYRQSLLKAAVEGALTAEWRAERTRRGEATESGAQLLARILAERRARWEKKQLAKFKEQGKAPPKDWKNKYPEPVQPVTADLPTLPKRWVWASLGQLLESLTSGSRDWAPYYDRGTCTFVMAQNVRPWRPDFSFRQLVDPPEGDRDRVRSAVEKDDLLVTIVGANTGQSCRVVEHLNSYFVCQSVALLRLVDTAISEYVNAVLNSEGHGQRHFRAMNYGAGRPHLSFEQLESLLVPLPPLNEQIEIIEQVEMSLMNMGQIESQLSVSMARCNGQRKSILKSAFSGQLVPQDPKDEPAKVLLDRIRAERAGRKPNKPPKPQEMRR